MTVAALQPHHEVDCLITEAPAKVNLTLSVLGRRADGFHELESLVMGVGLTDSIRLRRRMGSEIALTCDDPALACDDNLVLRAARMLAEKADLAPDIHLELRKRIPVAAGLGGGSSDAASTLRLCAHAWHLDLDREALGVMAARLGSDVPFFLHLPSAVMRGRGEIVQTESLSWRGWVLLVHTGDVVSTRAVYGAWRADDASRRRADVIDTIKGARGADDITELMFNDLEPAVFRVCPNVERARSRLDELGVGSWRVSGAGSTFFRLFDGAEEAQMLARRISEVEPTWRIFVAAAPVQTYPVTTTKEQ